MRRWKLGSPPITPSVPPSKLVVLISRRPYAYDLGGPRATQILQARTAINADHHLHSLRGAGNPQRSMPKPIAKLVGETPGTPQILSPSSKNGQADADQGSQSVVGGFRKYAGENIPEGMTKSAFKRQKKMERMELDRDDFIEKRKLKRREARKRNPTRNRGPAKSLKQEPSGVTVVIDCGFDEYMTVPERTSLAGQLTRCYSENRRASRPVDLVISGFDGLLKSRFDNEMHGSYKLWRDIRFISGDYLTFHSSAQPELSISADSDGAGPPTTPNAVYLTGDAEEVLEVLEAGTTYYVGGIVDKNRYTNLCLNKAERQHIRTARLPIDENIKVSGRRVLTTNQAFELLLRWIDLRDWKLAFEAAIPSRKLMDTDEKSEKKGYDGIQQATEPDSTPIIPESI